MAGIPKEHDSLYFDVLCRTQKAETVFALILATDHAWKKSDDINIVRQEIATRLVGAYNLLKDQGRNQSGAGSYTGTPSQFESQYTIGHEMCIWKGRNLKLTDLAKKVANFDITIKKYFDIFFLNYFQPVSGKAIHPLYLLLKYMKETGNTELDYQDVRSALGVQCNDEDIRSLFNFLIGTSYFDLSESRGSRKIIYISNLSVNQLLEKCNKKYIDETGLERARIDLDTNEKYEEYISSVNNTVVQEIDEQEEIDPEDISNRELFEEYITKIKNHAPNYVRSVLRWLNKIKEIEGVDVYTIFKPDEITTLAEKILVKEYWAKRDTHNEVSASLNKYKDYLVYQYGASFTRKTSEVIENKGHRPRKNMVNDLNIILYGPPGTGKTYSLPEMALACVENRKPRLEELSAAQRKEVKAKYDKLINERQIVFTTFHQNYAYEDFIEGLKPSTVDGSISFNIEKGIFVSIAKDAFEHPEKQYVLIIDEINRGNISRIFGELITLIEEDKRFGEENFIQATLPFGDPFFVPNNLYIIGTMNSADKSISLIDAALRRRFSFISIEPNSKLIDRSLRSIFENLNKHLHTELGTNDLLIGHAYFIGKKLDDVENIFNKNVIPLLYEYFYDDERKVKAALKCLEDYCDILTPDFGRITVKRKA